MCNLLSIGGTLASTVGAENPMRYRGYYYDTETGLYYLQSRYYNPDWGRFISKDEAQYHESMTGAAANLYAYCGNNPVMMSDPDGNRYDDMTPAEWLAYLRNPKPSISDVYDCNSILNQNEMTVNAQYILNYLRLLGWTKNSVCGMLGNMQTESSINPGKWEDRHQGDARYGFGLVQWTPATNYTSWAIRNGLIVDNMNSELKRIQYEVSNNIGWVNSKMTFNQFTKSADSAYNLAIVFIKCYERPNSYSTESNRASQAMNWYNILN